ncbi:uncharacterized protein EI97DRAFT_237584 [Westerdykella ornata]|uniref:Uncharacterized protein n=1 Tax=Westerdykella ornata TaxID=318751 RepID=A0A6A6J6M6_WESOR|nr:uncharacterized protein EI97DRAFT_237584 [Westerdykella ornata]KAF2272052.1 hypothetical protein EI97DRAFT_237584 [Westerdykella ornata]
MAETEVILLTLLPTEPREAKDFTDDISNIKIEVFDLTVNDSKTGVPVGVAEGATQYPYYVPIEIVPRQDDKPPELKPAIIQHFDTEIIFPPPEPPELPLKPIPKSVATAVIVVKLNTAVRREFESLDLRIVVTRGDTQVGKITPLEYNVPIRKIQEPLSVNPADWTSYEVEDGDPVWRAGYLFIPPTPKRSSTRPGLNLGGDGVTPVFADLVLAVNKVLEDDHSSKDKDGHTSLEKRATPLDATQALQVARELVFDRVTFPLPQPKKKSLADMYGNPKVEAQDDQERQQFEADLQAYHSQHDAEALQLANYIYAASAAIECERSTLNASSAGLTFDVVAHPPNPNAPFPRKSILLNGVNNASTEKGVSFGVPAAFFYALGCTLPTQLNANDRLTAAYVAAEPSILKTLQAAEDNGVLKEQESALTNTENQFLKNLTVEQAARRLAALGATKGNLTIVQLDTSIEDLVKDWLNFAQDSSSLESFWVGVSTTRAGQYLELLLDVVAAEKKALKGEIKTNLTINDVVGLSAVSDKAWRKFWLPVKQNPEDGTPATRAGLLPSYTLPGSPKQRTEAFIKHIRTLFTVTEVTIQSRFQGQNDVPTLGRQQSDVLQMFFDALPGFSFAVALDDNTIDNTLSSLPIDDRLKKWTKKTLHIIAFLHTITTFGQQDKQSDPEQFSLMEALYARGFITADRIAILSKAQFCEAMAGTVAYRQAPSGTSIAEKIYEIAAPMSTVTPNIGREPDFSFSPINPGQLVDCIPPSYLSPFGPFMYLRLLLSLKLISATSDPAVEVTLGEILQSRRGPLGTLQVSPANMEICVPLIDMANESLEALVVQVNSDSSTLHGAIFDTDDQSMWDLFSFGPKEGELDPEKALLAIPQHSSPYLRHQQSETYRILQQDFSSPLLPYDQELDINRTYLSALGQSRFDVMHTFRGSITEFVLDPSREPSGFNASLWRYPVRVDIAIEYLGISQYEYQHLFISTLTESELRINYGFPANDGEVWVYELSSLPVFLERTGLSYCEFYELWKTHFVDMRVMPKSGETELEDGLPVCEPCCLSSIRIRFGKDSSEESAQSPALMALYKVLIFVRLWRKLELRYGCGYVSMNVLAAVCDVLGLFENNTLGVNADFIRQLIALLILSDEFCLPLWEEEPSKYSSDHEHGETRRVVPLLALWADPSLKSRQARHAVQLFVEGIASCAQQKHNCVPRTAQFNKVVEEHLSALAKLAGFTDDVPWHAKPTCTLRFAEVLTKIYASPFTVGEMLFLFTNDQHLQGDDPFPYTEEDESKDDPLNVPEDENTYGLWQLRKKLLEACVDDEQVDRWSWRKIEHSLRGDFGLIQSDNPTTVDALTAFAEHFFPHVLDSFESTIPRVRRQFRTPLNPKDTNPLMWEADRCGPFHYSTSTSELWIELPLRDKDVIDKLAHTRQLNSAGSGGQSEIDAVRELYFAPRRMLAPFTSIFGNLAHAIDALVQEPCEKKRFSYFQKCFALFHRRCEIEAEHLMEHVEHVTGNCLGCDCHGHNTDDNDCDARARRAVAWEVIKRLIADENNPQELPWERDSGSAPSRDEFMWEPGFCGSAFSALLGLTGTGILGEFKTKGSAKTVWKEIRGPMSAFGCFLDESNVPVPTVIPALDLVTTAEQQLNVTFRNGLALDDDTAKQLGGAQPFSVTWKGILLIEKGGHYKFAVHRPTFGLHCHSEASDGESCDEANWHVRIHRGRKSWTVAEHNPSAKHRDVISVCLSRGAYDIEVQLEQPEPDYAQDEPQDHTHTGFSVRYCGPDTEDVLVNIPIDKLFIKSKDSPLNLQNEEADSNMDRFLSEQYISTFRDIRRTYQRAFKALLFTYRFGLSAEPLDCCQSESELGFILDHPLNFQGVSYYVGQDESSREAEAQPSTTYVIHRANLDFNFLPVGDAYCTPTRDDDDRSDPSAQRSSALFDWWERIFDYRRLARWVDEADTCNGPVWRLFYEAATQAPRDPATLLRLLGVELSLASLVRNYFENFTVQSTHLEDERWAIRIWRAWKAVQRMQGALHSKSFAQARPALWAATAPSEAVDGQDPDLGRTGKQNLMWFVTKSFLVDRDDNPDYDAVKTLNDGLRVRANKGLVAYLCGLDRVQLSFQPDTETAKNAQDLSALLLQQIDVGLCETANRVDEAISSVQMLVQRLQLGLETKFRLPPEFTKQWDSVIASFEQFEQFARRVYYSENWIQWEELRVAKDSEAFTFLEHNLDVHSLAVPKASPPFSLTGSASLPKGCGLSPAQAAEFLVTNRQTNSVDQGIGILGTPARSAQRSWLSSSPGVAKKPTDNDRPAEDGDRDSPVGLHALLPAPDDQVKIPMWFQAAVRLGTTFIRVAAASVPPAMWASRDEESPFVETSCHCGKSHAPVMDEYYFWLEKGEYFNDENAIQDANLGVVPPDPTTDWERDETLPKLLHWPKQHLVHLHWTRIHYREFSPPGRSSEGQPYDPRSESPSLAFNGRRSDSLFFTLFGSANRQFRYDIATNAAVALPQTIEDALPTTPVPAPLTAFPFFAYFSPGAPIFPTSSFGSALAVAGALRAQCRFEEALAWCKAAFNPLERENTWAQCRQLALFARSTAGNPGHMTLMGVEVMSERRVAAYVDGPCCPTSPVQIGISRARAVVLEYLQILLEWGDALHCKNTFESRKRALVLFNEAIRLLGPKPSRIHGKTTVIPVPRLSTLDSNISTEGDSKYGTVSQFVPGAAPLNPKLLQLYELAYHKRDLIQRCVDANKLDMHPTCKQGAKGLIDSSRDSCGCGIGQAECRLPYKFTFLLAKALDLVNAVKALGQSLLVAIEKGDAEHLASLRQAHERQMNDLILGTKQNAYRESDWLVQTLEQQMQGAQTRLRYYQQLLKNGLNAGENAYLSGTAMGMQTRMGGNISEGIGQGMSFIPDFTVGGAGVAGSPVAINQLPLGSKLAEVFQAAARILNVVADVANTTASVGSTQGGWDRRAEEWQHQVDVVTIEIAQIKRQQLASQRRRDISLRELNNHQIQIENSAEVDAFLNDKMSKQDLYLFLQQETATLYRRTFDLAWQTVKEAEAALRHERRDLGDLAASALPPELGPAGWDNLHSGLMAGEKLEYALRTLDRMYLRESGPRDYELTKRLSLRLHFPLAFLQLKTVGWCEFEIPEWMFDLDHPGHYLRRIKNVSITIPCVVGPFVGVHCRLQLLSSATRLYPTLPTAAKCCCNKFNKPSCIKAASKLTACKDGMNPFASQSCAAEQICTSAYTDPSTLHRDFLSSEAIATSTAQNDSGLFELSFRDEVRRAPFEFAGAVASRWRVELPLRNNAFDLDSVTDLILQLNYTAAEGGPALREVADRAAWRRLPGDGVRFFDVRSEFPNEWRAAFGREVGTGRGAMQRPVHVRGQKQKGKKGKHHGHRCFPLEFSKRTFPFITSRRDVVVSRIDIFIDTDQACGTGQRHFPACFVPQAGCKDDVRTFEFTSSSRTPGFFHGVLGGVRFGPLGSDAGERFGHLKFHGVLDGVDVRRVYLLCYYDAVERESE